MQIYWFCVAKPTATAVKIFTLECQQQKTQFSMKTEAPVYNTHF